jgi:hypothetical protein
MNFAEIRKVSWDTLVEALGFSVATDATLLLQLKTYTVLTLPDAATYPRGVIYVSDEAGGATIAFSDSSDWRRAQDRAVVS